MCCPLARHRVLESCPLPPGSLARGRYAAPAAQMPPQAWGLARDERRISRRIQRRVAFHGEGLARRGQIGLLALFLLVMARCLRRQLACEVSPGRDGRGVGSTPGHMASCLSVGSQGGEVGGYRVWPAVSQLRGCAGPLAGRAGSAQAQPRRVLPVTVRIRSTVPCQKVGSA